MRKLIILIIICLLSINVEAGKIHMRIGDQNSIAPYQYDMSFLLDGTIIQIGGNYYFKDRTKNNRHFLITNYDFPTGWTYGLPYKSAATISAPANDMELWAYDVDSFLYDGNHNPRQIPVVSLFQNIDYANRLFCKHEAQVLNGNGVETYAPRVSQIVLYRAVKTNTQLTICNNHFDVPVKSVTHIRQVGAGKIYSTIQSAINAANAKDTIYIYTGVFNESNYISITKNITIIGLGYVRVKQASSVAVFYNTYATFTINNIIIDAEGKTTRAIALESQASDHLDTITINRCFFYNIKDNVINGNIGYDYMFSNVIFHKATYGIITCNARDVVINGCYGINMSFIVSLNCNFKYNRIINNYDITTNRILTVGNGSVTCSYNTISTSSTFLYSFGEVANRIVEDYCYNDITLTDRGTSIDECAIYLQNSFLETRHTTITHNVVNQIGSLLDDNKTRVFTIFNNNTIIRNNIINTSSHYNIYHISVLPATTNLYRIINIDNNYIHSNFTGGSSIIITIGAEIAMDNFSNNSTIIGNVIINNGSNTGLHGILSNCGTNISVKYNNIYGCYYGIIIKTGQNAYSYTTEGVYSNIINNCAQGIIIKGVSGINVFNNTIINSLIYGISCLENNVLAGNQYTENSIIKNNIFFNSESVGALVQFDQHAADNGCLAENNILYGGQYFIIAGGSNYSSFLAAQAAGLLSYCLNENPNLKSATELWSTTPITSIAEDLGSPYNVGLDTISTWGSPTTIPVITTKNQPATWQIGAYIK